MSAGAGSWQRKIDHGLRALIARVPEADRTRHKVSILLRFTGSVDRMRQLGLEVRSVAGDIATATLALADTARIAGAPEITFIELAQPLGEDMADGSPFRGDVDP
ncbi:MAG TPA: hypothetical protein VF601_15560 [Beijerinckiaceae bacterium]|jgi:hypothetical protein